MDIAAILPRKYPNAEWVLNGDEYSGLEWLDDSPKPTEKDLVSCWPEVQESIAQEVADKQAARDSAIAHAKSLGFTDEMIGVMYPGLTV